MSGKNEPVGTLQAAAQRAPHAFGKGSLAAGSSICLDVLVLAVHGGLGRQSTVRREYFGFSP